MNNNPPQQNVQMQVAATITPQQELQQTLQARQLHFATFLEMASEAIISIDSAHNITLFSKGAELIFGYNSADVIGQPLDILLPQRFRAIHRQHLDRFAAAETTTRLMDERKEIVGLRKDGTEFPVEASIAKLSVGDKLLFSVVLRDISERRQAEQQRERLIAELDAYAHTAAHDLKGPLALILGYVDLLKTEARLPDEHQNYLNAIHHAALKMHAFIDEIHLLAEVNRTKFKLEPLHMGRIIAEAQQRLAYLVQQYEAQIIMPQSWPVASGYAPWIEMVWANYISNAIKYGGRPPIVSLGATICSKNTIRFWVRDNGPGLTEEEQGRLFKPFSRLARHTARDAPNVEGFGVGLETVRKIISQLGGKVGVQSEGIAGKGSTFWFILPQAS